MKFKNYVGLSFMYYGTKVTVIDDVHVSVIYFYNTVNHDETRYHIERFDEKNKMILINGLKKAKFKNDLQNLLK